LSSCGCLAGADTLSTQWIEEVRSICGATIPVILVGCKADLRPSSADAASSGGRSWVTYEQGAKVAQTIGARAYKECSALKIEGVDDVFETATRASMLMRDGVSGATDMKHHRRRSSGKSAQLDEPKSGLKCCVIC